MGYAENIGRIQARVTRLIGKFPFTCNVERASLAADGRGGKEQAWTTLNVAGPLACVHYPASGKTRIEGGVPKGKAEYVVLIKGGADVMAKDRVRVLALAPEPERLVEVSHVLPHMGAATEIVGLIDI